MSAPSLVPFIMKRPWLMKIFMPLAERYANLSGYRQLGLLADDLINEENEVVALAVKRLSPKESYDRVYRIRRAMQADLTKKLLPREQWTKPEDDVPYLAPLIKQIEAEIKEKEELDTIKVANKH